MSQLTREHHTQLPQDNQTARAVHHPQNPWLMRANQWQAQMSHYLGSQKPSPVEPLSASSDLWQELGDDFKIFEVEDFLQKQKRGSSIAVPALPADPQALENKWNGFVELSCDRLLDSYRYLLSDRVSELFPFQAWTAELEKNRFLKTAKQGHGLQWSPPMSQKGREKLVRTLSEPVEKRVQDVLQDCLAALFTRAERLRTQVLETLDDNREGLQVIVHFFDRIEKQTSRDIVQSVLPVFHQTLDIFLLSLSQDHVDKEAFVKQWERVVGQPVWPMDAQAMLTRGWTFQAALYGGYIHLGFLTHHAMECTRWWFSHLKKERV